MAARVLCRRVPVLRHLPGLRKDSTQARQLLRLKRAEEAADQRADEETLQHWDAAPQAPYRLCYNPDWYHSVCNPAASLSHADNDKDECPSALVPSVWQQTSRRSVTCSRYFSSSNSTPPDSPFNRGSEPPSESLRDVPPIVPGLNINARAFLDCRPEYASMSFDINRRPDPVEWVEVLPLLEKVAVLKGGMKPSDASQLFVALSHLHPDNVLLLWRNRDFITLLRYSVEHLGLFTAPQLMDVLRSFVWLHIHPAHTALELYEAELCRRVNGMSMRQLLLAADLWRYIRRTVPQFLRQLYASVPMHSKEIGVPELVLLLYLMGECRKCPADWIHLLEQLLMLHVHELHPDEVGTVCLGLFKSQTSLSEAVVTDIVMKAQSFVEEMSNFAVVNVMKYLRFSYLHHKGWLDAMAQEVPRRAHGMGVSGLMHVALACSALHFRNEEILMAIAEQVPPLALSCRSKDSSKLLWAFGSLRFLPFKSPNFYSSLTDALRQRIFEFQQYPEHLLTALLGLTFVSQFPEDLIAFALSSEFVNLALSSKRMDLSKDLFTLDETVALELPRWTGPRLGRALREEVAETLWEYAKSDICQKPDVLAAENALQELLGGEEFVRKTMILPHTRSIDLEVHLDAAGKPLPVNPVSHTNTTAPEHSPSKVPFQRRLGRKRVSLTDDLFAQLTTKYTAEPFGTSVPVKHASLHREEPDEGRRPSDPGGVLTSDIAEALIRPHRPVQAPHVPSGTVKLAIQVSRRKHYCYNTKRMLGIHAMKRRQLKLLGYRIVTLHHHEWSLMMRQSRTDRLAYLNSKICNSLE